jgi:hypothetical protein
MMTNTSFAIADLQSRWRFLNDLDRTGDRAYTAALALDFHWDCRYPGTPTSA